MFHKLKESALPAKDPTALAFDLFVHTCDVAGALGHVNNASSLSYTEETHRAMQAMAASVKVLQDPECTEKDAYQAYLTHRAAWLALNPQDRSGRVLTRIGAMLRLFTPQEGALLQQGLHQLDPSMQKRIVNALDVVAVQDSGRTPTYMPAVLVNLANQPALGSTREERLVQAVRIGLPFLTRVLEKHREMMAAGDIDPSIPLNFNPIAGIAKTAPEALSQDFAIDTDGKVHLLSPSP